MRTFPHDTKRQLIISYLFPLSDAVVVMVDKQYPHTNWFVLNESEVLKKEYCYELKQDNFVTWTVRETRKGVVTAWSNLIFIQKRFEKILTITKKRSLFFAFKSYVIRDRKGAIAGVYSWLRTNSITLFYPKDDHKFQIKFPISGESLFTRTLPSRRGCTCLYLQNSPRDTDFPFLSIMFVCTSFCRYG